MVIVSASDKNGVGKLQFTSVELIAGKIFSQPDRNVLPLIFQWRSTPNYILRIHLDDGCHDGNCSNWIHYS